MSKKATEFQRVAMGRKILETVYPPERWTMPGCDPVKEYDALAAYLKTYSKRTIRRFPTFQAGICQRY